MNSLSVHALQGEQLVAASPSWSHVPAKQFWAGAVPPTQYCPTVHAVHTRLLVVVGACVCTKPAAHVAVTAAQAVAALPS
jgi:hypothetical protein